MIPTPLAVVVFCGVAVLLASKCAGLPYSAQVYKQATSPGAFIGEGINVIAAAFLQDESKDNAAYSPLGYSAILAALTEGASGKTRSQMLAALKLPQDSSLTRATYRSVLGRMKEKNAVSKPEFRSWFYVYAKSTKVEDSYSAILREHYLMTVRDIQAVEEDTPTEFFANKEDEAQTGPGRPAASAVPAATTELAEPAAVAVTAPQAPAEAVMEEIKATTEAAAAVAMEKLSNESPKQEEPVPAAALTQNAETEAKSGPVPAVQETSEAHANEEAITLDAPKAVAADTVVKQVEVESIVAPQDTAKVGEAALGQGLDEDEDEVKPADESKAEDKVSLAKFGKGEAKDEKKPTSDKKKDDKKKGRDVEAFGEDGNDRQPSSGPSLLTAFNALYYRGAWQFPFDAKFRDDFLVGDGRGEKKEVTTLRTQGTFRIGDVKELNATAIELPYKGEGGRYSLLVLLPKADDGLPKLTEALAKYSFRYLAKSMREKQVDVAIPEFEIDCISHPQAVFRKLGMTAMLDKEGAEFPGISKNQRLYLQDDGMAQLVRFKVDDKNAVANYLSAMSMSTRSGLQVFHANHPFVFYLRDNVDNLTVVVGRVADPTVRPDNSALDAAQAEAQAEQADQVDQIRRL